MLWLDIETYSSVDLRKSGVYPYVEAPDHEILMCGWTTDRRRYQLAIGEDEIVQIPGLLDPSVPKVAHNASFERVNLAVLDPAIEAPDQWVDTMALAAEHGYPRSLDALAKALGAEPKDSAGTHLINWFCKPDPKTGARRRLEDHPEKWRQFCDYCVQDVRTLADVWERLPGWPTDHERRLWVVDQKINDRGIQVDVDMAQAAVTVGAENRRDVIDEARAIAEIDNPNSVQQLTGWLNAQNVRVPDLRAETVSDLLTRNLTPDVRRVLEIRQELALAAEKKYAAALAAVSADGRFRGGFKFYGAHTGRWSGQKIQLQNMPRAVLASARTALAALPDDATESQQAAVVESYTNAAIFDLCSGFGATPATLKALLRAMLLGPFTVVDYAAIEARFIAWLAGEEWALQAFRDGRDIYVETAERMGGRTRQEGKVAVLALGYAGGVNSLRVMGGDSLGTDAELDRMVAQWRRANPAIVRFWSDLERAFWRGGTAGRITVERDGRDRHVVLPSGRPLVYHGVRRSRDAYGRPRLAFADPKGFVTDTYGGRLAENVTQAGARDVLAAALVRLDERGYPVVGHVHDEAIVEGTYDPTDIARVMCEPEPWMDGLPLAAEGFVCERYRK